FVTLLNGNKMSGRGVRLIQDELREARDGATVKEGGKWDIDAEHFFDLRRYAQGQHRVPTKIEEVVGDTDRRQVQNVLPDVGDLQLDQVAGGNKRIPHVGPRVVGFRQRIVIDLAVRR